MKISHRLLQQQKGQALILAMVMLAVGSIILAPLIGLVTTSLNVGRHTEIQVDDYYAADAGVETAIWYIRQETPDFSKVPENVDDVTTFQVPGVNGQTMDVKVTRTKLREFKVESTINPNGTKVIAYVVQGNLDIFDAALASTGDITLKKNATVDGPIFLGGSLKTSDPFYHDATLDSIGDTTLTFPSENDNNEFALGFKIEAQGGGTHVGDLIIDDSNRIFSGPLYITGNLTTEKDLNTTNGNPIVLNGTIYVEGTIHINDGSEITGHGSIVSAALDNGNNASIQFDKVGNFGDSGSSDVIYSVNGSITFKKDVGSENNPVHALIYAPNGNINFNKLEDGAYILGSLICGSEVTIDSEITADKNFSIEYDPTFQNTIELPGFNRSEVRTWTITSS